MNKTTKLKIAVLAALFALTALFTLQAQDDGDVNYADDSKNALEKYLQNSDLFKNYGNKILYMNDPAAFELFEGQTLNINVTLYAGGKYFIVAAGDRRVQIADVQIENSKGEKLRPTEEETNKGPQDFVVFTSLNTEVYTIKITLEHAETDKAWISWLSGEIDMEYGGYY